MHSPFDLDQPSAYRRWRDTKWASHPQRIEDLVVELADPRCLRPVERDALLQRCALANMAIYRSPISVPDKAIARLLATQLGLHRLDGNWLADEDGISRITVAAAAEARGAFIPYTDRPIRWHTDGYYLAQPARINAMLLHCVAPAASGGSNGLMDHEMADIALREADPDALRALMAGAAMTIPARLDEDGVARPAQAGPVFSVDPHSGMLHMRYTARTRSVQWKDDPATGAATAFLAALLEGQSAHLFRVRLEAGMGIVCNNVLHDRSGFVDDPQRPRLLYRARYCDRIDRGAPRPRGLVPGAA